MAEAFDFFNERRCRNSLYKRFAGRVDVENEDNIRQVESAREIIEKVERSCEAMRLKYSKDTLEVAALCSAQRCGNLGRMMRVIVDDSYAGARLDLEPPVDPLETGKSRSDDARFDTHIAGSGKRRGGIQDVVHPWYI